MRSCFAAFLVITPAVIGLAQPATARSSTLTQRECGTDAPTLGEQNSTQSLSDRLAQSKGVICPPRDVDPEMNAPPPAQGQGKMPIIPPPGSGNPKVQPR